jgi:hypothetical protein
MLPTSLSPINGLQMLSLSLSLSHSLSLFRRIIVNIQFNNYYYDLPVYPMAVKISRTPYLSAKYW